MSYCSAQADLIGKASAVAILCVLLAIFRPDVSDETQAAAVACSLICAVGALAWSVLVYLRARWVLRGPN
jgi:hypothetical protein